MTDFHHAHLDAQPDDAAAYFNEFDAKASAWIKELQAAGFVSFGPVDERSIVDVTATDVMGYRRCHFFAGIAGWELALQLAGWPADRPVWTGSCPCQPFSAAGKQKGEADERHLWPEFRRLIAECRPATIFGEQVASKLGREWLAGVRADLEALGYAIGAADLCAAGVGSPHIRQRLFWVANAVSERDGDHRPGAAGATAAGVQRTNGQRQRVRPDFGIGGSSVGRLADAGHWQRGRAGEREPWSGDEAERGEAATDTERRGSTVGLVHSQHGRPANEKQRPESGRASLIGGHWDDYRIIPCRDGKARRVSTQPALSPLADGIPGRVGLLRGAGNAIVPQVAATFIRAFLETEA